MTPLTRACRSPPPSSSAVTSSPVAAFTSGGPPRKIVPWSRTMTASSLIAGHVRAARGAGAEHGGDLRDAARRHRGLVVEDAAEVLAVGEDLVLLGQERAAGVDEVDARQVVVQRDLLGAQVLLDGDRVVGAALDGGVVGDDHALAAGDAADAGDDAGGGRLVVVQAVGGQRRQLQEARAGVEQAVDAVARQQLAARDVALPRALGAAQRRRRRGVRAGRRRAAR